MGINFSYTTPNILLDDVNISPLGFNPLGSVITPNLFPGVSISSDLGNGPGIQEVATFSVDVAGPSGSVAVSNAHGTVTGAAGGCSCALRPPDLQERRQRHLLRRTLGHEVGPAERYTSATPDTECDSSATLGASEGQALGGGDTRSSVAVIATRTWRAPAGP